MAGARRAQRSSLLGGIITDAGPARHISWPVLLRAGLPLVLVAGVAGWALAVGSRAGLLAALVLSLAVGTVAAIYAAVRSARGEVASARLDAARSGFQWLLDHLGEYALLMLDSDGRVLSWSRSAERLTGTGADAALQMELADFLVGEDAAARAQAALGAARQAQSHERSDWWRRGGTRFRARCQFVAVRERDGALRGYALLLHDETAAVRAREAIAREVQLREAVLRSMPGIFYMFDADQRLQRWNENLARVTGYAHEQLRGKPLGELFAPRSDRGAAGTVSAALEHGSVVEEGELLTRDGQRLPHVFTIHRTRIEGGACLLGVGVDISEREQARVAQDRLVGVLEATTDFVLIADPRGTVLYANRAARELFGLVAGDDLSARQLHDFHPPWAADLLFRVALPSVKRTGSWAGELAVRAQDGREVPVSEVVLAQRDEHGDLCSFSTIGRDLSSRIAAEEALLQSEARYRALYHDNPSMFFTLDTDGVLLSANRFGAERLGTAPEALRGQRLDALSCGDAALPPRLQAALARPGGVERWEMCLRGSDGERVWVRASARGVARGGERQVLLVCEDMTETHALNQELAYQAEHDVLTGLYNRRAFERHLDELLSDAQRSGRRHALCYLDLDQFKVINDTSGHVAGDELLRRLSVLLANELGRNATLARVGGDEFGLLIENQRVDAVLTLVDRARRVVEDFGFTWGERQFRVAVSIGVVAITPSSTSASDLLRQADLACYAAKEEGRNKVHVYHAQDRVLVRRHGEMEWVAQIPRALEEGRLRLYCQPIVALADGAQHTHYEFLLRMLSPEGELVSPGAFLPAAERYGLSTTLDRWVVSAVLSWLAARKAEELARIDFCSVNLSAHSLSDKDFTAFLSRQLEPASVRSDKLCFEVTETAAISDLAHALRFIDVVKARGCRLALDDFGTGFSSYAYLKTLPVDYLKIDGAFVRDIVSDPIDRAFVKSIHEVGHAMGMRTIAEYAENEEILDSLRALGIDYAQGYGVGRPRPALTVH